MKTQFSRIHFKLSKQASRISSRFIWISLTAFAIAIIIIPWLGVWMPSLIGLSKFWVDILSPVSLRNIPYTPTESSWYSSIAYSIGIIVITGVLIALVTNYLRTMGDRYRTGTLDRYHWTNHTLFLGYDDLMIGTLRKVCSKGGQVVVAVPANVEEIRAKIAGLLGEQGRKVEVIQCNYTETSDLKKKACAQNAAQIFFIGHPDDPTHDASNLKSMDITAELLGENMNVAAYIYIRNRASLSLVQRQGFANEKDSKLRRLVNPFNFYENMAGNLLAGFDTGMDLMTLDYQNEKRNLAVCQDANVHFVILGMTEVGMALAREALEIAHYPGRHIKVTLVDENAREEMFFFRGRYKELFSHCKSTFVNLDGTCDTKEKYDTQDQDGLLDIEFEFLQGSFAHPQLMKSINEWFKDKSHILTIAICSNDSPKNMATALYMPRTLLEGDEKIHIWVYQQGDDSLKEFCGHEFYKHVHTFSANEYAGVVMKDSPLVSWAEIVAKAYKKSSTDKNVATEWDNMNQYERWSNLYNVRSAYTKLRRLGIELSVKNGEIALSSLVDGGKISVLDLSDKDVSSLAETEHLRWIADTLTKGFRPTEPNEHDEIKADKSLKNKYKIERFAHDDLRKYSELDDNTKQYDVNMTLAIIKVINSQFKKY